MKLYLLTRTDKVSWDEYSAKVVAAETPLRARQIANTDVGDEGKIWEDTTKVVCKEVKPKHEGVVLASFINA